MRSLQAWLALHVSAHSSSYAEEAAGLLAAVAASPAAAQLEGLELNLDYGPLTWPAGLSEAFPSLHTLTLQATVSLCASLTPLQALRQLRVSRVRQWPAAVTLPPGLTSLSLGMERIPKQVGCLPAHLPACLPPACLLARLLWRKLL